MNRVNFSRACELINIYFQPLHVDARRDGPHNAHASVHDPVTGVTLLSVLGLDWPHRSSMTDIKVVIRTLQSDLAVFAARRCAWDLEISLRQQWVECSGEGSSLVGGTVAIVTPEEGPAVGEGTAA